MSSDNLTAIDSEVWQWKEWQGLPYLTCKLLNDWQHGFFTQQCYPRLPEDLVAAFDNDVKAYRVKQVHGNTVLTPQEIVSNSTKNTFVNADGIITDEARQSVWVASADCNPILIADRTTGQVAAIHAGWRGTAQKIVGKAIALFQKNGSDLSNLSIAIGPAISGEVYQVSETVAIEVGNSILKNMPENASEKEKLKALFAIKNSPLLKDEQPERVKLDVRRVNQIQLQQLGINPKQIEISPYCTYQQPDYFFSYRRSKQKKIQWSGIVGG
jgi:YfiH family protein